MKLDLKVKNNTPYGVLVQAGVSPSTASSRGSITVKMWSTKVYPKVASTELAMSDVTSGQDLRDDQPDCEPTAPVQGFDVRYQRLFYSGDTVVKRQHFSGATPRPTG